MSRSVSGGAFYKADEKQVFSDRRMKGNFLSLMDAVGRRPLVDRLHRFTFNWKDKQESFKVKSQTCFVWLLTLL